MNNTFSWDNIKRQVNSFFTGAKVGNQVLKDSVAVPVLEQIFLVESESGLLCASYSATDTLDEDMIAAMLNAIVDFGEDTLLAKDEDLTWLQFDVHKIYIKNIGNFDIALVISGVPNAEFVSELDDAIFDFFEKKPSKLTEEKLVKRMKDKFKSLL